MLLHLSKAAAAATAVVAIAVTTPAGAGASGPSSAPGQGAAKACTKLNPALSALTPGTKHFRKEALKALKHGCVVYVSTLTTTTAPSVLDLELVRGPGVGHVITIGTVLTTTGGVTLSDIALTSSGQLYGLGLTDTDFYAIDADNAHATVVASGIEVDSIVFNGLVVSRTGTVYASGSNLLDTIDPVTGALTSVGTSTFGSSGDLAFSKKGTLFMSAGGVPDDNLVTLNTTTGAGTLVGSTGQTAVWGLASSLGTLFGATNAGDLLTLDKTTGVATVIATGGPPVAGMASLPNKT